MVREAYATDDPRRVDFVRQAADVKSADAELRALALIQLGHFSFEMTVLRPFVHWSRLFWEGQTPPDAQA